MTLYRIAFAALFAVSGLTAARPAAAGPSDLSVVERELLASRRVGRAHFEYTYQIRVNNGAEALTGVVATVSSLSADTVIVDDRVVLGALASGVSLSTETFTMRQNRRVQFNPSDLVWSFTADEPPPVNDPPLASAGADASVPLGNTINLDGTGSNDPNDDLLTYEWQLAGPLGSSAALDDATAAMPAFSPDVVGTYTATLIVNDGQLDSDPDSVLITAVFAGANAPQITSTPPLAANVGGAYGYDVDASDPDAGDVLTYSLAEAPAGMTIDALSGLIRWVPDATGAADVDVHVTDSTGRNDRQIFLLPVRLSDDDQPPLINAISALTLVVGEALELTVVGTDPEAQPLRYSVLSGPDGLAVNSSTGALRWTPAIGQVGGAVATVAVSDPGGQAASTSFALTVLEESINSAPVIDPLPAQTVSAQSTLALTATASDEDAGELLSFSLEAAPSGLTIDPRSGFISWTPGSNELGGASAQVVVTDSAGDRASTILAVTVVPPSATPVAVDDAYTVGLRETLIVGAPGVLGNDTDANGDVLSAATTVDPALGNLMAFAGDGSFSYQPPPIPPIDVGLALQCATPDIGSQFGMGYSVADVDADGALEIVVVATAGTFSSAIRVYDAGTCALEREVQLAAELGEASSSAPVTLVNLDADPELEIVVSYLRGNTLIAGNPAATEYRFMGLNLDGSPLWNATGLTELPVNGVATNFIRRYVSPSAVDLNGDGVVELLVATEGRRLGTLSESLIVAYNGSDGTVLWEFVGEPQARAPIGSSWAIADLDLDGTVEIIYGNNVIDHEGNLEFLLPVAAPGGAKQHLTVAVANFDSDPYAELIAYDRQTHTMIEHTGAIKWQRARPGLGDLDITVAELDGDGLPEYVLFELLPGAATYALNAYDSDGSPLWSQSGTAYELQQVMANSNSTPVAFDFDRDGIDELVVHLAPDNAGSRTTLHGLYVFSGEDGTELASYTYPGNTNSAYRQTVSIVDVDGDNAAELILKFNESSFERNLHVLEGLPGNPFPPARPIHNQHLYMATAVNDDASIPRSIRPHWLIPGLNKYRAAPVVPGESPTASDGFRYVASDGSADSNEAKVDIAIATVNAPTIVSTPPTGASPGFEYRYAALATDADFGTTLTWTVADGPAAMVVDSFGIVSWTPSAAELGAERVQLVVSDDDGNTDAQVFEIAVLAPVTVPDLLGLEAPVAAADVTAAGLAPGSVTSAFSLTVPSGAVISQSLAEGSASGAGAFLDYVVSLGPPPIFAPDLVGLNVSTAEATLASLGAALGVVDSANSSALAGTIIAQSAAPQVELSLGAAVDITVSSGPALRAALAEQVLVAGQGVSVKVEVFDSAGEAVSGAVVTTEVVAEAGVEGALPSATATVLNTAIDTRGAYRLEVDAGSFGQLSLPFIVRETLEEDDEFTPIAAFANVVDALPAVYEALASAINSGDLLAVNGLAVTLRRLRDELDLELLADTNPMAPEQGFLPDRDEAAAAGFPQGFSILSDGASAFRNVENAFASVDSYLEQLDPARGRDDDQRARFVNGALRQSLDALLALDLPVGTQLALNAASYGLLSQTIPERIAKDLDFVLKLLETNGLAAAPTYPDGSGAEQLAWQTPGAFYAATRPTFFTLGGMMTATAIRSNLIKSYYVPYLTRVVSSSLTLATADAIRETMSPTELTAIITGASQSFHTFKLPSSSIEAAGATSSGRAFTVTVIGPDTFQQVLDKLAGSSRPTSGKEARKLAKELVAAGKEGAAGGVKTAKVHAAERGCFFENNPACTQIVLGAGFPVVHSSGTFPAPVVVLVRDRTTGQLYIGTYPFFPQSDD